MKKNFLVILWVVFGSMSASASDFCRQITGPDGNILANKDLLKKGIIHSGPWATDDINEYYDFPLNIKRALKSYGRFSHVHIRDLIESAWVNEVKISDNEATFPGFYVQVENEDAPTFSDYNTVSGAIYKMTLNKLLRVAVISKNKIIFCK